MSSTSADGGAMIRSFWGKTIVGLPGREGGNEIDKPSQDLDLLS